ncbi:hypothetical protein D9M68_953530 [compost metagenome]
MLAAVAQGERTVASHVHIPDLDVGLPFVQVVLARQRFAHPPVARLVVDGDHLQFQFCRIIDDGKQPHLAHEPR